MKRLDLEENSRSITLKYITMEGEMTRSHTDESVPPDPELNQFYYIKITEIPKSKVKENTGEVFPYLLEDFFIGMFSVGIPISVVMAGDSGRFSLYIGSTAQYLDTVDNMIKGTLPYSHYELNTDGNIIIYDYRGFAKHRFGGIIKGNPGIDERNTIDTDGSGIDTVIRGMNKKSWIVSIFAHPLSKADTLMRQQYWLTEATECSELTSVTYTDSDSIESVSYAKQYYHSEQYLKKVKGFSEKLLESAALGEWCVSINFAADSQSDAMLLGGLAVSAFFKDNSQPEPVHVIYGKPDAFGPLVNGTRYMHQKYCPTPYPKYANYLSSRELAVFSELPHRDVNGISVTEQVDFDVNRTIQGDISLGRVIDTGLESSGQYQIKANEFNRHCLTVGLTGGGKTNTLKSLLYALSHERSLPFMVIEPAKKEYWELYKLGFSDLQIYSVGSHETNAVPLCINPFERVKVMESNGNIQTIPIQTHIDFIYAAFKASFIMYTPMPYVLERAIYEIYEDCGWNIKTDTNSNGNDIYPTIEDLYFKIPQIVTDMGYDQRMCNDLIGSLGARINSLRLGAKGDTLNVARSYPIERLFSGNTVIELEDIGDDDVKAFIISLLLVNLLEYRRMQPDSQLEVKHITLIEEAHRLLKNVQSGSGENADPRGAAVEFFCNMLAELRSKGQGFIIADQIPSKLAPDLIKNTNLKIVHRTVDKEDRELIGGAMHMTDDQIESLSSLRQGVAAIYSEGDNRPKLVKAPYAGDYTIEGLSEVSRNEVLRATGMNAIDHHKPCYNSLTDSKNALCRRCNAYCEKKYTDVLLKVDDISNYHRLAEWFNPKVTGTCKAKTIDDGIRTFIDQHLRLNDSEKKSVRYCILNCLMDDWQLDKQLQTKLVDAFTLIERR